MTNTQSKTEIGSEPRYICYETAFPDGDPTMLVIDRGESEPDFRPMDLGDVLDALNSRSSSTQERDVLREACRLAKPVLAEALIQNLLGSDSNGEQIALNAVRAALTQSKEGE